MGLLKKLLGGGETVSRASAPARSILDRLSAS
jgi:hypothetical protein